MNFQSDVRGLVGTKKIEVTDDSNNVIGYLQILSDSDSEDMELIEKFSNWRNKYMSCFFTSFISTNERTKKWIMDHVLKDENKVLLKILNKKSELVGHIGAIDRKDYIEYDNLIRAGEINIPNFTYFVTTTFMRWLFSISDVDFILGKCISSNLKGITLHKRTGFKIYNEVPLRKIIEPNGDIKWVEDINYPNPEFYSVEIRLYRKEFMEQVNIKNNYAEYFAEKCKKNIDNMASDEAILKKTNDWICLTSKYKYTYNFKWLGRTIIQFPQDMIAMQEIIWEAKPDLIIETGIAHGGSLIFYASMLELLGGDGQVLGIDIDIRKHNRVEIEKHPMFKRITMIQGSSIDNGIAQQVYDFARDRKQVLVVLDSNHTHKHVLRELQLYSPLVTKGSYLVVFDTVIEDMPEDFFPDRPWGKGDNPKTALWEFLKTNNRFEIDKEIENKLLITVAPDGYLKCIKD